MTRWRITKSDFIRFYGRSDVLKIWRFTVERGRQSPFFMNEEYVPGSS